MNELLDDLLLEQFYLWISRPMLDSNFFSLWEKRGSFVGRVPVSYRFSKYVVVEFWQNTTLAVACGKRTRKVVDLGCTTRAQNKSHT